MEHCTNINCHSKLPEPLKKLSIENKGHTEIQLGTEASNYRQFDRSRPRCRRAIDNLRPEGDMFVSTELSSNFQPRPTSRPRSARDEFRKRRDNLKTEGQMMYQAENKAAFMAHTNERPKIFKPKLCHDCHDEQPKSGNGVIDSSVTSKFTETHGRQTSKEAANYEKEKYVLSDKQTSKSQFNQPKILAQTHSHSQELNSVHHSNEDMDVMRSWPGWTSRPPDNLGGYVRSVFLDLCDGRSASELQVMFPHQWGVLVSRLKHRPDLRLQLQDRVTRGS